MTIDDGVFDAVKAQAQASGRKLGKVLSQMVRRGLRASTEAAKTNGLPVFKVPQDAPIIPSSRARDLLAEEST